MPVGLDCYTYYNSASYGSPTWVLLGNIKDLQKKLETAMADASSRGSRWKSKERTLKDKTASFGYVKKTADATAYAALRTAQMNDVDLDMAFADGPIATTGTKYIRAILGVTSWEETEPLENVVMAQVEVTLIDGATHPPAVVTVA